MAECFTTLPAPAPLRSHLRPAGSRYERYEYLISGQADADVEEFLSGEHPFDDYRAQVERFHDLSYEINCQSAKVGVGAAG